MAEPEKDDEHTKSARGSDFVTTRVNVAFPFSQIKVQQPSEDLVALAALVRDLADALAEIAPESKARELADQARALALRLT